MEQIAFTMQLKPGQAAEYERRHDAIWPELVELLKQAGISDYSIFLDETTGTLFAVLRQRRSPDGHVAPGGGDATLVGLHGRTHGRRSRQRAGDHAATAGLPFAVTDLAHGDCRRRRCSKCRTISGRSIERTKWPWLSRTIGRCFR